MAATTMTTVTTTTMTTVTTTTTTTTVTTHICTERSPFVLVIDLDNAGEIRVKTIIDADMSVLTMIPNEDIVEDRIDRPNSGSTDVKVRMQNNTGTAMTVEDDESGTWTRYDDGNVSGIERLVPIPVNEGKTKEFKAYVDVGMKRREQRVIIRHRVVT